MVGKSKKKLSEQAAADGMIVDPLNNLQISVDSYDVKRIVSVYADNTGEKWWTKAWFNDREKGEPSVEITRNLAIAFIKDQIRKDDWLSRYYPKQMTALAKSIENTRRQLLGI